MSRTAVRISTTLFGAAWMVMASGCTAGTGGVSTTPINGESGGAPTATGSGGSGSAPTGSGGAGNGTGTGSSTGTSSGGARPTSNTGGASTGNTGGRASGGRTGTGGTVGTGTGGASMGVGGQTTPPPNCGSTSLNQNPFGCSFSWGRNNPGGSLTSFTYLQFMSNWIGTNVRADGTYPSCLGCTWLTNNVASTNLVPVFYAYLIGYFGHINGLPDQNVAPNPNANNLATNGAQLIRDHRAQVVQMYAWYAQQAATVWPTRPLVWLLDGDFVQYTATSQTAPLTYAELGSLTGEITCAIKTAMPNAVVAINHSAWNADAVTNGFWGAMANVYYDLVWTTGMGSANGFFTDTTTATSYNGRTATYAYMHRLTGRKIWVDTSFGASAMGDSWSNATADVLNARIADGVIGVDITGTVPTNYATAISSLAPSLNSTCQ